MEETIPRATSSVRSKGFRKDSKSAVVALVERESGKRRSVILKDRITATDLRQAVHDNVEAGSTINTDEHPGYVRLRENFTHKFVRHGQRSKEREFHRVEPNGEVVSTNLAESSFSLLRRGVIGTFHSLSRKYLPLYVSEFDFRFNHRKISDGERFVSAIQRAKGKRVTLKQLRA